MGSVRNEGMEEWAVKSQTKFSWVFILGEISLAWTFKTVNRFIDFFFNLQNGNNSGNVLCKGVKRINY